MTSFYPQTQGWLPHTRETAMTYSVLGLGFQGVFFLGHIDRYKMMAFLDFASPRRGYSCILGFISGFVIHFSCFVLI
ncbi:hypothetical protein F5Y02DRAFT_376054 [Annulohypoxylon stygium]|nr:hypothetical protein F5Y02DRAFT_376054 [Annulohypoxylon stygium]